MVDWPATTEALTVRTPRQPLDEGRPAGYRMISAFTMSVTPIASACLVGCAAAVQKPAEPKIASEVISSRRATRVSSYIFDIRGPQYSRARGMSVYRCKGDGVGTAERGCIV